MKHDLISHRHRSVAKIGIMLVFSAVAVAIIYSVVITSAFEYPNWFQYIMPPTETSSTEESQQPGTLPGQEPMFLPLGGPPPENETSHITVAYTASSKTVCDENGKCILALYSGSRFAQNSTGDWVDSGDVLGITKSQDDLTFHYDGIEGYFNMTLETGVIHNENYYSMQQVKQMYPEINFSFPLANRTDRKKHAVNITNIPVNIQNGLESITLTYKNHYGFNLSQLRTNRGRYIINEIMEWTFDDLWEWGYTTEINLSERRLYIGNLTSHIINNSLYLDPTLVLTTADTENLDDTQIYEDDPTYDYGTNSAGNIINITSYSYMSYFKFNISMISAGQQIDKANFSLYIVSNNLDNNEEFDVIFYYVKDFPSFNVSGGEWTEGDESAGASTPPEISWNTRANTSDQMNTSGYFTIRANNDPYPATSAYFNFSITGLIAESYANSDDNVTFFIHTDNPSSNAPEQFDYITFRMKEMGGTANDPILYITYSPSVQQLTRPVQDSMTLSDQPVRSFTGTRKQQDSMSLTDQAVRTLAAPRASQDSMTLSDQVKITKALYRNVQDSMTISDQSTRQYDGTRELSDSLTCSDSVISTAIQQYTRNVQDSLTLNDQSKRIFIGARTSQDSMTYSDQAVRTAIQEFTRIVQDPLAFSDQSARQYIGTRLMQDSLAYSDYAVETILHNSSDWWNTSYDYRYNISNDATSEMAVSVNDTAGINGSIIWARILNSSYVYSEDAGFGGDKAIANDTTEKFWENESSKTGNSPQSVWDADDSNDGVWHFGEGTGTIANDSTSNDDDGTITDATWTTAGKFGGALDFDGNADYVTVSNRNAASYITYSAWVNQTSVNPSGEQRILSTLWVTGGSNKWAFVLRTSNLGPVCYTAKFGQPSVTCTGTGVITLNVWHFLACTKNETHIALWVDGLINKSCAIVNQTGTIATSTSIGAHTEGTIKAFNGTIDEPRISYKERSAAWMLEQYYNGIDNLTTLGAEEVAIQQLTRFVQDSLTFGDQGERSFTGTRTQQDSMTLSDQAIRITIQELIRFVQDSLTFSDQNERTYSADRASQDSLTYSEQSLRTYSANRVGQDSLAYSDQSARTYGADRVTQDSFAYSEQTVRAYDGLRATQDGLAYSDSSERSYGTSRVTQDSLAYSDGTERQYGSVRQQQDSLTYSDQSERSYSTSRVAGDGIAYSDQSERQYGSVRQQQDSLTYSDQSVRQFTGSRELSDSMAYSDQSERLYSANRLSADSIAYSDHDKRSFTGTRKSQDGLTYSDQPSRTYSANRVAQDSLSYYDQTVYSTIIEFVRLVQDSLTFGDQTKRVSTLARVVQNYMTFSDQVLRTISVALPAVPGPGGGEYYRPEDLLYRRYKQITGMLEEEKISPDFIISMLVILVVSISLMGVVIVRHGSKIKKYMRRAERGQKNALYE